MPNTTVTNILQKERRSGGLQKGSDYFILSVYV